MIKNSQQQATPIAQRGVGGFITYVETHTEQGVKRWHSRKHRKGYGQGNTLNHYWPSNLNRAMATLFMIGASLFVIASFAADDYAGLGFACGSVFFTSAAYLQFYQAINSRRSAQNTDQYFAWQPRRLDYWVCLSQLIGTVMFNFNTFDALLALSWQQQQWAIWAPNISGSILFQMSGSLAILEYCHRWFCFSWRRLGWWICQINNGGCIAFLASAILAYTDPAPIFNNAIHWSEVLTIVGAVCFFSASLLLYIEDIKNQQKKA
jgi:hypothetical protein